MPMISDVSRAFDPWSGSVTIAWRVTLWDAAQTSSQDVTDDVLPETVEISSAVDRAPHRVLQAEMLRPLDWGSNILQVEMVLTDALGATVTVPAGRYIVAAAGVMVDTTPGVWKVAGVDLLDALATPIGAAVRASASLKTTTQVRNWITDNVPGANHSIDSSSVGCQRWEWPADGTVSMLSVINEVLGVAGNEHLWVDGAGVFRSRPIATVLGAAPTVTINADDVFVGRRVEVSGAAPNEWIIVREDSMTPVIGDGMVRVQDLSTGRATSIPGRAGRIVRRFHRVQASSQADLEAIAARIVAAEQRGTFTVRVECAPIPTIWHIDPVRYVDRRAGINAAMWPVSWSIRRGVMSLTLVSAWEPTIGPVTAGTYREPITARVKPPGSRGAVLPTPSSALTPGTGWSVVPITGTAPVTVRFPTDTEDVEAEAPANTPVSIGDLAVVVGDARATRELRPAVRIVGVVAR